MILEHGDWFLCIPNPAIILGKSLWHSQVLDKLTFLHRTSFHATSVRHALERDSLSSLN